MSTENMAGNRLDARLIERCEEIPDCPAPGNYVVIDVLHFSNTAIKLLEDGAAHIHITEERGQEFAYKAANPSAKIGGGSTDDYEPTEGYDFFNSPAYVAGVDVDGFPVSMTSSNGGRALVALRECEQDDVDVYVGSTMNARALGRYLQHQDGPTYLVSSGSKGDVAIEDHVGATLISRYLDGLPPSETEIEIFEQQVRVAKGDDYADKHELRRADVFDYAANVNKSTVIPKLDGDCLVRASKPVPACPEVN
jgi:2-phosphosulfolactate phosphatase